MADKVESRSIIVNIVADDVRKQQDALIAKQKKLNDEIKRTNDPKALKDLESQLKRTEQQISRNEKVLKGELTPTIKQLEKAVRDLNAEFKRTGDPETLKRYAQANELLRQQKAEILQLESAAKGITKQGFFSAAFWANLAAGGIAAATAAIGSFFRESINEAAESDRVTAQLRGTLDNLGRTDVFDRLIRKADEMANRFKYLDNDEVVGVFNKLIDYGKLTEQQMNDLLPVIIDFAAKTRQDIGSATESIIGALEGNGKALKQFGIDIKDAGTESERLNEIMTTLKQKVDGAGASFQQSAQGGIASARQEFKNLQEDIGNGLIPVLNRLLSFFNGAIKGAKILAKDLKDLVSLTPGRSRSIDNNEAAAIENNQAFFDKIKDKNQEERIKLIKEEIENREYSLDLAKKGLEYDIKGNLVQIESENEQQGSIAYANKRIQLLKDELTLLTQQDVVVGVQSSHLDKQATKIEKIKEKVIELHKWYEKIETINVNELRALERKEELLKKEKELKEFNDKNNQVLSRNKNILNSVFDTINGNNTAGLALRILQSEGKEKLKFQKQQIEEEAQQEIDAEIKKLTDLGVSREDAEKRIQNIIALIREKARQDEEELEKNFLLHQIDVAKQYVDMAIGAFDQFNQARANKENAELEADRKRNDQKAKNLKRQLDGKVITQLQYNRQIEAMEREADQKERKTRMEQFRRNQRLQIAQTIMNAAQGIVSTFAARPGLADVFTLGAARAIQVGLIVAASAAQIASINAQRPQFARGGKLGGRLHSDGGNAITDGSGRKIAEIEAGEGIINRHSMADRKQYSFFGTPSQVASAINTMHGGVGWEGGATQFKIPGTRYINYGAANKRYYAEGGQFQQPAADNSLAEESLKVMMDLRDQLRKGIVSYTVLTQQEIAQKRLDDIRDDATWR